MIEGRWKSGTDWHSTQGAPWVPVQDSACFAWLKITRQCWNLHEKKQGTILKECDKGREKLFSVGVIERASGSAEAGKIARCPPFHPQEVLPVSPVCMVTNKDSCVQQTGIDDALSFAV